MGRREFPVGQVCDNLTFILASVAASDVVEVKSGTKLIATFRTVTERDKAISTRHLQADFARQAGPLLRNITAPFAITGLGGKILAVVEPKSPT